MFTLGEFEQISSEFMEEQKTRRKKLQNIWGFFLGLTVSITILLIIVFPNQFKDGSTAWILPTYGGIALVTTLLGFLISLNFLSEKPFFTFLFPEVIQKINQYEGLYLEYIPYDKIDKEFNKIGGLFTRMATVRTRRHIKGQTEDHHSFDIYDCTLTTSSGNSQQTHFDGTYIVLEKSLNTSIQIRTNGAPKLKGVKFHRLEEFENLRVFKEAEQNMSNIDHLLLRFVEKLSSYSKYKRVFLSVIDGQIHVALWYKKHPARKQKTINLEILNKLTEHFMSEYQLVNEITSIDVF